jgi:hypothetical protein
MLVMSFGAMVVEPRGVAPGHSGLDSNSTTVWLLWTTY